MIADGEEETNRLPSLSDLKHSPAGGFFRMSLDSFSFFSYVNDIHAFEIKNESATDCFLLTLVVFHREIVNVFPLSVESISGRTMTIACELPFHHFSIRSRRNSLVSRTQTKQKSSVK